MGACLCRGHKELHSAPQHPMVVLQSEGEPSDKDDPHPSNGSMADKKSNSGYDIGELATSSLLGLVATIKEHITKPTAMAQGRVAHLIEWKGWGGGGETGGGGGWGRAGLGLQEDEQLYSEMTDEIKEARFAAGVAQQFALAEASMNMWSNHDSSDHPSTSLDPLHDTNRHFLSHFLLDGGSVGVPQHLYSIHAQANNHHGTLGPPQPASSISPMSASQHDSERPLVAGGTAAAEATVRHVDSSSLSEDEVFYN
ncbi:protein FAM131C [Hypomesus transpacificus]|uniref:protein FAM131C n=1 Tax=Hypomesus transpacificus TaxID=137520 RepID=UPI001F07FDC6|nr:protein FAM131C [Hypomesus transpacificus]